MKHAFFLWLTGLLLILLQALPWNFLFPETSALNLSFTVVVMAGFYGGAVSSWLLALTLGYALEALSGSPAGLVPLINLLAVLIIRVLAGFILFERLPAQLLMLFFLFVAAHMALLAAAWSAVHHPPASLLADVVLKGGAVTVLSVPLLLFFNKTTCATER